jgi:hypothetical protein
VYLKKKIKNTAINNIRIGVDSQFDDDHDSTN